MDLCTYENRDTDVVALKLAVESAARHMPHARFHIPTRGMGRELVDWLNSRDNVVLHQDFDPAGESWNVKISVIRHFVEKLGRRVTWIDSDINFQSDISHRLDALEDETIVVAEEGYRTKGVGTAIRTRGLGLSFGRELGFTVNSCVVSVCPRHRELIDDWAGLAVSDDYLRDQAREPGLRARWHFSDQDLLGGLLGSKKYLDLRVGRVRSGRDIAHTLYANDFTLIQRLSTVFRGEPAMVHSQGVKVWTLEGRALSTPRAQYSPYRFAARKYDGIFEAGKTSWMTDENRPVRILAYMFPNRPSLIGLPLGFLALKQRAQDLRRSLVGSTSKTPKVPADNLQKETSGD